MKPAELLKEVVAGRLLIVGEYRGGIAEVRREVDRTTGEAYGYVQAILAAECKVRGNMDRVMLYQRLPEVDIEDAGEVLFPYEKGRLYVFFLFSLKNERRHVTGSLADQKPELLELVGNEVGGPVAGPLGPAMGPLP